MIRRVVQAASRRFIVRDRSKASHVEPSLCGATADLESVAAVTCPFALYETLRTEGSVVYLQRNDLWIVLGNEAVKQALEIPEVLSNSPYEAIDSVLLGADPPRHGPIRRLLSSTFSAGAMARLEEVAVSTAQQLVSLHMDAVNGFAVPITHALATELLGLSRADLTTLQDAATGGIAVPAFLAVLDEVAGRATILDRLRTGAVEAISEADLRSVAGLLWLAATTTTERVIVWSILELLLSPDVRARVTADRDLLPRFVEEVMRLHPPEHLLPRQAKAPLTLAGVHIPAGAQVRLCVAAANRDPALHEAPASLRLDRPVRVQWAFGAGPHRCPGAPLTRRLVPRVLNALLDATPDFQALEPLDSLEWFATSTALAPRRLLVGAPGYT